MCIKSSPGSCATRIPTWNHQDTKTPGESSHCSGSGRTSGHIESNTQRVRFEVRIPGDSWCLGALVVKSHLGTSVATEPLTGGET